MQVTIGSPPGRASVPAGVLGLACGAGGLLCLLSVAFPYSSESATSLALVVGIAGLIAGFALIRSGNRTPALALHGALMVTSVCTAAFVAAATTIQEQLLTAMGFIWIGLYVACFFDRVTTMAHIAMIAGCYTVALWLSPIGGSVVGAFVMVASASALALMTNALVSRMRQLAELDPLTDLLRRAPFTAYVEDELRRSQRHRWTPSLAILDLDGFKEINDSVGHSAGDALLTALARAWTHNVRPDDVLCRYGGDEFALFMPDTPLLAAKSVLLRLEQIHLDVTWSVGVTEWRGEPLTDWIARTDRAMYEHKRSRRGEAAS